MATFPEPFLHSYFAPSRFDAEIKDCIVQGALPAELNGAFYRMHGDWLYMPKHMDETPLAADGYMSKVRIKNGKASYVGKYVETERYKNQLKAGRQVYGYYRNEFDDDPSVTDIEHPNRRCTSNTTPAFINQRLFATKEDGLPHELDPNTLESKGASDFDGDWDAQTFSAHSKYDARTKSLYSFGYEAKGTATEDLYIACVGNDGQVSWDVETKVPYTSLLHDQVIAGDYIIIPGGGTVTSLEGLKEGKPHWGWDSKLPSYHIVVPKGGKPEDVRTFYGKKDRCHIHTANGWQEGDTLTMIAPVGDVCIWPWFKDVDGKAPHPEAEMTLRRITYDLSSDSDQVKEEVLFDTGVSGFTRIDDRFHGVKTRYVWSSNWDKSKPFEGIIPPGALVLPDNSVTVFDLEEMTEKSWFAGPNYIVQEPVFIPRSPDAPEGDGFLIFSAHNFTESRAEIVVLDAQKMEELGRVILPFRNPFQVHGLWAHADELPLD